jgi:hypothetical protein
MKKWAAVVALAAMAWAWMFVLLQTHAPGNAPNAPPEPLASPLAAGEPNKFSPSKQDAGSSNANSGASPLLKNQPAGRSTPSAPGDNGSGATASQPQLTNLPSATVLDNMRLTFRHYTSMFGGNPVGTNPEITAALNGKNPKQANFIDSDAGMRINANGELVDPWGTPYFFHQLSGTVMEIHSAGPDRILWTADDLVVK